MAAWIGVNWKMASSEKRRGVRRHAALPVGIASPT
jgi:hypothetical protein